MHLYGLDQNFCKEVWNSQIVRLTSFFSRHLHIRISKLPPWQSTNFNHNLLTLHPTNTLLWENHFGLSSITALLLGRPTHLFCHPTQIRSSLHFIPIDSFSIAHLNAFAQYATYYLSLLSYCTTNSIHSLIESSRKSWLRGHQTLDCLVSHSWTARSHHSIRHGKLAAPAGT